MITLNQLVLKKYKRLPKNHRVFTPALKGCPQKKAVITKLIITTPKKPNSAKRQLANIRLTTGKRTRAGIPGAKTSHGLKEYSRVLIRGGRVRDTIGVRYRIILGGIKYDGNPYLARRKARSKYGVPRSVLT